MAELVLRQVRKSFGKVDVLQGIDLTVADGEFIVFVGPSGCGKSTLLRLVAGLEPLSGGDILVNSQSIAGLPAAHRGVAMVFQNYALYPHMTVAQNMGFALKMAGAPLQEIAQKVGEAAEVLQITALLDRKPKALSGGQRQRVAIGRAIVRRPQVFLFDEPLSNLDASLRVQMRVELARLHRELGTTMVYVTHDQVEAMTLGHRIALFDGGRLSQVGAPLELFERPQSSFVAGFLGSPRMNLVACTATAQAGGGAVLSCAAGAVQIGQAAAGDCLLGIRPEDLQLRSTGPGWRAQVDLVEHLGDTVLLLCTLAGSGAQVTAKQSPGAPVPALGSQLLLHPAPHRAHLFSANGQRRLC